MRIIIITMFILDLISFKSQNLSFMIIINAKYADLMHAFISEF